MDGKQCYSVEVDKLLETCVCSEVYSFGKGGSELPVFLESNVVCVCFVFLFFVLITISEVKSGISRMWVLYYYVIFHISDGLRENQVHDPAKLLPRLPEQRLRRVPCGPMWAPPVEVPFLTSGLLSLQGWGIWPCPIPLGAMCLTS